MQYTGMISIYLTLGIIAFTMNSYMNSEQRDGEVSL